MAVHLYDESVRLAGDAVAIGLPGPRLALLVGVDGHTDPWRAATDRLKSASGLFSLMRSLGGAIGIAACGTILNDRTNLHFLRIAEHLTSANAQFMSVLHEIAAHYTRPGAIRSAARLLILTQARCRFYHAPPRLVSEN